jgi:hypothetical protein
MLKNSHFRTPRTLDEGTFVTGYRCAQPVDQIERLGHVVLNAICVALLVGAVPLILMGVL